MRLSTAVRPATGTAVGRIALLAVALSAVTAGRWVAQARLPGDDLLVGVGFGMALLAVAVLSGWRSVDSRPAPPSARRVVTSVALGAAVGLVLIALAVLVRTGEMPGLRPATAFLPWVAVTGLVATAEEVVVRGALFGELERGGGPLVALLGTSLLFALMHLPLYGWQALPLDLGVGLVLGGLRLATGGLAAPIAAHTLADLATWWL